VLLPVEPSALALRAEVVVEGSHRAIGIDCDMQVVFHDEVRCRSFGDDRDNLRHSFFSSDKAMLRFILRSIDLILVSLVVDTRRMHALMKKGMEAAIAIERHVEHVMKLPAEGDDCPVTRIGERATEWLSGVRDGLCIGWQSQQQGECDCQYRGEPAQAPPTTHSQVVLLHHFSPLEYTDQASPEQGLLYNDTLQETARPDQLESGLWSGKGQRGLRWRNVAFLLGDISRNTVTMTWEM